jgi:hypothetical protein
MDTGPIQIDGETIEYIDLLIALAVVALPIVIFGAVAFWKKYPPLGHRGGELED